MIFLCSFYQQRIKNFPELLLVSDHIWWHIVSSPFFSSSVTGKMQQKKAGGKGKNLLFLTSQNPWHQLLWLSPIPERKVCVSSQESLHQAYRWWGCLWVSYSLRHYIYIYIIPLISSLWFFFGNFHSGVPFLLFKKATEIMPEEVISIMAECFWWQHSLLQVMLSNIKPLLH